MWPLYYVYLISAYLGGNSLTSSYASHHKNIQR